jgi:hypothetical protein
MEEYLKMMTDFSSVGAGLGIILATYALVFMSCNTQPVDESNRVISTLTSVIRGEISSLKDDTYNENPYDLFTRIYPTLKEMNNQGINELIELIENYNNSWIDTD